jgi:transcriptional regulator
MAKSTRTDLLQGTLDMLILRTLALGPQHGWGISQRIQQVSQDVLQVNQGSLYPALHRLELQGWITSDWGVSDSNRQAKFYQLTRAGQKQLQAEAANWDRITAAVARVMNMTPTD